MIGRWFHFVRNGVLNKKNQGTKAKYVYSTKLKDDGLKGGFTIFCSTAIRNQCADSMDAHLCRLRLAYCELSNTLTKIKAGGKNDGFKLF